MGLTQPSSEQIGNNMPNTPVKQTEDIQELANLREQWLKDRIYLEQQKDNLGLNQIPLKSFSDKELISRLVHDAPNSIIASSILDIHNKLGVLAKQYQLLWPEEHVIREFNKKHAIVHIDQTYMLTDKDSLFGGKDFSIESRASFRAFYEDEVIQCADGKTRCKADIWLKSPHRRKFIGITFDPTTT